MIKAIIKFRDIQANRLREIGETWKASEERENELIKIGFVEKVEAEVMEPEAKKTAKVTKTTKTTKKK